jgi:hypothetical protein
MNRSRTKLFCFAMPLIVLAVPVQEGVFVSEFLSVEHRRATHLPLAREPHRQLRLSRA